MAHRACDHQGFCTYKDFSSQIVLFFPQCLLLLFEKKKYCYSFCAYTLNLVLREVIVSTIFLRL